MQFQYLAVAKNKMIYNAKTVMGKLIFRGHSLDMSNSGIGHCYHFIEQKQRKKKEMVLQIAKIANLIREKMSMAS